MVTRVFSQEVTDCLKQAEEQARDSTAHKTVLVDGGSVDVPYPFPSPADWRDRWIYFLMLDRFNNPDAPPNSTRADPPLSWNRRYDYRQGGTFEGVTQKLSYIQSLGAGAIWLSPVLKSSRPEWAWNYHGYGAQDFLSLDERFSSDGTEPTAEKELAELVEQAHARGLHVIMDIVLNHAGHVFDYVRDGGTVGSFQDPAVMNAPLGQEPPVQWLNGLGVPRTDWQDSLPDANLLSRDDAVWPADLQRREFFRRRGEKLGDAAPPGGFVRGDFGDMRQLVVEYDAQPDGQQSLRETYGKTPVLAILIRIYQYLIAKYDLDGFRIDTVKYVDPQAVEVFGNAIREFALSIGKRNFFTFGEIYDNEVTIAEFVGRNSSSVEGFGIDAALDFPLFFVLPAVVKSRIGVEGIRQVFEARKRAEEGILSSHGEAGRFFVSFLDNHDQVERFNHPDTPAQQITLGLGLLYSLQGIPCLYYGTEQGLQGTVNQKGDPDLGTKESVREALWGRPNAFDTAGSLYQEIGSLARLRANVPALRYGRLYFRQVSGNGQDFGQSQGPGGIVAFSRILNDTEVVVVANTGYSRPFSGWVLVDRDLSHSQRNLAVLYSNLGTTASATVQDIPVGRVYHPAGDVGVGPISALPVNLRAMEIQVLAPA